VIAFGVVGASLLLQGLTMSPLITWLGLRTQPADQTVEGAADLLRARISAVEGALLTLDREHERGEIGALQFERLSSAYNAEHAQLARQLAPLAAQEEAAEAADVADVADPPPADAV
jgi:NhaP-type Na+/H+ or K+/H+ antiporter